MDSILMEVIVICLSEAKVGVMYFYYSSNIGLFNKNLIFVSNSVITVFHHLFRSYQSTVPTHILLNL